MPGNYVELKHFYQTLIKYTKVIHKVRASFLDHALICTFIVFACVPWLRSTYSALLLKYFYFQQKSKKAEEHWIEPPAIEDTHDLQDETDSPKRIVPEKITVIQKSKADDAEGSKYTKQQGVGRMKIDEVPENEWDAGDEYQGESKHTKSLMGLISKVKWGKKRRTKAIAEKRKQKAKDVQLQTEKVEESLVTQSGDKNFQREVPSFRVFTY